METTMITYRTLTLDDVNQLQEIDRSNILISSMK